MNLLDMVFFDVELWDLVTKFILNAGVVFVLIRLIYYPVHRKKENLFTYFVFNVLIFFLCYLMNNVKLSVGFGFGLFAIFSVIRYRTEQVEIKDMTYLFAVITLAVINSLAGNEVSWVELLFANTMILAPVYLLERVWLTRHEASHEIIYERIELVKPEKRAELLADLEQRLGIKPARVEVGRIDLLRDTARLRIFYFQDGHDQEGASQPPTAP